MNLSYILLVHRSPNQVERLIKRLSNTNVFFYVHVDMNVDITPYLKLTELAGVTLLKNELRVKCAWGHFNLVQATLNALKLIIQDKREGYSLLISGQDYPIRRTQDLLDFLEQKAGLEFIDIEPLPRQEWANQNGGFDRLSKYYFFLSGVKHDYVAIANWFHERSFPSKLEWIGMARLLKRRINIFSFIFKKREIPSYIQLFGGSQWWALSTVTIEKIMSFISSYPEYLDYHKHTLVADEILIHSIVGSIVPQQNIASSLTLSVWETPSHASPKELGMEDFEILAEASNKFFARKFNCESGFNILDKIDSQLLHD